MRKKAGGPGEKGGGTNGEGDEAMAVLVVDIQGDFTELRKGSLAVPGTGEDYIRQVEGATSKLKEAGFFIVGTQDWHPADHVSFHTAHPGKKAGDVIQVEGRTQALWPPHCIADTENADIVVDRNLFAAFMKKARDPKVDSYSAFQDELGNETGLHGLLRDRGVKKIVIFGLAIDYCVKYTTLHGLKKGYRFFVIEELSRGIDPETTARALDEMRREGAVMLKTLDIEKIRSL